MNIRIRHISHRRKGLVVQNEKLVQKQSITIGRATDQDIFLSDLGVAYRHARINFSTSGQIGIASLSQSGLYVNGKFSQSGSLKGRGECQVGPYRIVIERNHEGFDFDITVEQIAEDAVALQSETLPAMTLEETWLSRRRGAWVGFILVLLIFLAFPLAGYFDKDIASQQRGSDLIPDDGLWQSGEVSSPHKHFAKKCDSCHLKAFEMVPDKACASCHKDTTVHADPEIYDLHSLQGVRCATCHKEHNGTEFLVRRDQFLCSDCHSNLRERTETELENITDFSDQHPEFMPKILFNAGSNTAAGTAESSLKWQRVSLDTPGIRHETGVVFPHDIHLDVNGLDSPTGSKVLQCSACHQTDAGDSYMMPVEFEQHCQECHRLTFDPGTPERELPHSNLDDLSATLDEYYAFVALRGGYEDDDDSTPAFISQRRIPGKELTPVQRRTALAWAQEKAADVKEEVIEFRTCGLCHKVERDEDEISGWRIPPVQISQRWFTKGAFDHAAHRATDCADCHDAESSKHSEDLLMPGIKVCRDCHGGEHADSDAEGKLESGCISCHVFHTPDALLLGDRNTGGRE